MGGLVVWSYEEEEHGSMDSHQRFKSIRLGGVELVFCLSLDWYWYFVM
jgi:hypothetical protein